MPPGINNNNLREDSRGYLAVPPENITVKVINYPAELQKWLRQEIAAGTSKRDIISIIENQTSWDKKKIVNMFPELKSSSKKFVAITIISLILIAALLMFYPAIKEGLFGKAIGIACQQDSDCSEREICHNSMCIFNRTISLIAHYDFSEAVSINDNFGRHLEYHVQDLSANSNNLSLERWWKVQRGAFNAEGTIEDYLVKQNFAGLEGTSAFTIVFHMKGEISDGLRNEGIVSYATRSNDNEFLIYYTNGRIRVYVKNQGTGYFSTQNIYDGRWHDVGVTWNGADGKVRVYVDGNESSLISGSRFVSAGRTISGDGSLVIGQDQDCMYEIDLYPWRNVICAGNFEAAQSFYGKLDNLRIYTTVLSRGEIASLPEAVEMLVGGPGIGIAQGYRAGNLKFVPDRFGTRYNMGEINVNCIGRDSCVFWKTQQQFFQEHVTDVDNGIALGTDSNYCRNHRETAGCDYTGYIMYSAEDVHTRFGDNVYATQGNNVIGVCYYDGQWYYDDNNACNEPFAPVGTDVLLAEYTVDNGMVVSVTDLKLCTNDSLGECTSGEQCTSTGYYWYNNRCNFSPDTDNDGIADTEDNCPLTSNANQQNDDEDHLGNSCDNCPRADNPTQKDSDKDNAGDACDNCQGVFNPLQSNLDRDTGGDLCDDDMDEDRVSNDEDSDDDMDRIEDEIDNCPFTPNNNQLDSDHDGIGDRCDNCHAISNVGQEDFDLDYLGDLCDVDDDNDLILDAADICPHDKNNDIDNDSLCADVDNCPYYRNPGQEDEDGDGIGDVCDLNHCNYEVPVIGTIRVGSARGNSTCADRILDAFGEAAQFRALFEGGLPLEDFDCAGAYKGVTIVREEGSSRYFYVDVDQLSGNAYGSYGWNNACPQYIVGKPEDRWTTVGPYKVPRLIEEARNCIDENAAVFPGYDRGCDDIDGDNVLDEEDNCLAAYNLLQEDADGDGRGDACDFNFCESSSIPAGSTKYSSVCAARVFDVMGESVSFPYNWGTGSLENKECAGVYRGIPVTATYVEYYRVGEAEPYEVIPTYHFAVPVIEWNLVHTYNRWNEKCPNYIASEPSGWDFTFGPQPRDIEEVRRCIDENPSSFNIFYDDGSCLNEGFCDSRQVPSADNGMQASDSLCADRLIQFDDARGTFTYFTGPLIGALCEGVYRGVALYLGDENYDFATLLMVDGVERFDLSSGWENKCPDVSKEEWVGEEGNRQPLSREQAGLCIDAGEESFVMFDNTCDRDADSVPDNIDNCPGLFNPEQADSDLDGIGNECDNCPDVVNLEQVDSEGDGLGDACDDDDDNDGIVDEHYDYSVYPRRIDIRDNCRIVPNPEQLDGDRDDIGNECDDDKDNDEILNEDDNCKLFANPLQEDTDGDGVGDACDELDYCDLELIPELVGGFADGESACAIRAQEEGASSFAGITGTCEHVAFGVPLMKPIGASHYLYGIIDGLGVFSQSTEWQDKCSDYLLSIVGDEGIDGWGQLSDGSPVPRTEDELFQGNWAPHSVMEAKRCIESNPQEFGMLDGSCIEELPADVCTEAERGVITRQSGREICTGRMLTLFGEGVTFHDALIGKMCTAVYEGVPIVKQGDYYYFLQKEGVDDGWEEETIVPEYEWEGKCIDYIEGRDAGWNVVGGESLPTSYEEVVGCINQGDFAAEEGYSIAEDDCGMGVEIQHEAARLGLLQYYTPGCGIDGDGDGDRCDAYENMLSCPDDCERCPLGEGECIGEGAADGLIGGGIVDSDGDGLSDAYETYLNNNLRTFISDNDLANAGVDVNALTFYSSDSDDSDGDGVGDSRDYCPGTAGTANNARSLSGGTIGPNGCYTGDIRGNNNPNGMRPDGCYVFNDFDTHKVNYHNPAALPEPFNVCKFSFVGNLQVRQQEFIVGQLSLFQYYTPGCGIDSDNNGNKCDAYEHMLNCPDDCGICPAEVGGLCVGEGIADSDADGLSDAYEAYLNAQSRLSLAAVNPADVDVNAIIFYSSASADSDEDGVPDNVDYCPGTAGTANNARSLSGGTIGPNGCYTGDIRGNDAPNGMRPDGCYVFNDFDTHKVNYHNLLALPVPFNVCNFRLR